MHYCAIASRTGTVCMAPFGGRVQYSSGIYPERDMAPAGPSGIRYECIIARLHPERELSAWYRTVHGLPNGTWSLRDQAKGPSRQSLRGRVESDMNALLIIRILEYLNT